VWQVDLASSALSTWWLASIIYKCTPPMPVWTVMYTCRRPPCLNQWWSNPAGSCGLFMVMRLLLFPVERGLYNYGDGIVSGSYTSSSNSYFDPWWEYHCCVLESALKVGSSYHCLKHCQRHIWILPVIYGGFGLTINLISFRVLISLPAKTILINSTASLTW
jgi:hypothetical protein